MLGTLLYSGREAAIRCVAIGGVEGIYDRHEYFSEKADALQRLADLIERIVNPAEGNVLPMRR